MTDTTTPTDPDVVRARPSVRGTTGWVLIVAGLVSLGVDVPSKSGLTILGLEMIGLGLALVTGVLRRQAVRRAGRAPRTDPVARATNGSGSTFAPRRAYTKSVVTTSRVPSA